MITPFQDAEWDHFKQYNKSVIFMWIEKVASGFICCEDSCLLGENNIIKVTAWKQTTWGTEINDTLLLESFLSITETCIRYY